MMNDHQQERIRVVSRWSEISGQILNFRERAQNKVNEVCKYRTFQMNTERGKY